MPQDGAAPSERDPLLPPQPSTVDTSIETPKKGQDGEQEKPERSITRVKGFLCVVALGCLIFLQGIRKH